MKRTGILAAAVALAATAGSGYAWWQSPAAADRARASVRNAQEHHTADRLGRKALYHPGYISRIEVAGAGGGRQEVYRQTKVYRGQKPKELALTFRESALAVFDPQGEIATITVRTTDGEEWTWAEEAIRCPPFCRPDDTLEPVAEP